MATAHAMVVVNEGSKQAVTGRIWWCADNMAEAQRWKADLLNKGALSVELKPEEGREVVDVIITLERVKAAEILGGEIDDEQWMVEAEDDAPAMPALKPVSASIVRLGVIGKNAYRFVFTDARGEYTGLVGAVDLRDAASRFFTSDQGMECARRNSIPVDTLDRFPGNFDTTIEVDEGEWSLRLTLCEKA
ncbi:hypothetical protein [Geopseudomonas aromaticivorans]